MPPKKVAAAAALAAAAARPVSESASAPVAQQAAATVSCTSKQSTVNTGSDNNQAAVRYIVNELLTYIVFYKDWDPRQKLNSFIIRNFIHPDVLSAKRTLISVFETKLDLRDVAPQRLTSDLQSDVKADVEDVIAIIRSASVAGLLKDVQFVAVDLGKLPKCTPFDVNMSYVIEREEKVDNEINKLSTELADIKQSVARSVQRDFSSEFSAVQQSLSHLQRQYEMFSRSMTVNVNDLLTTCSNTNEHICKKQTVTHHTARDNMDTVDRSLNVVVTGIGEDKNMTVWRDELNNVFKFIVGREVEINDSFRLGRYTEGKVRPILVKLNTAWDRRLILYSCNKLKTYPIKVYINADESLEDRRKKTLARLSRRAEREGKIVSVENGVLVVNGVEMFSLSNGSLVSN